MRLMIQSLTFICALIVSVCITKADDHIFMAPHLAIYDLQLENASDKSDISALTGRMAYEFNGSSCDGYTTKFRFVTRISSPDMPVRMTDQQLTTFETGDGNDFHFVSKTIIDEEVTSETDGLAKRDKNGITVTLKKPDSVKHHLKRAVFPLMQTEDVIRNAQVGKHFYRTALFDGSDDADKITEATVVIGDKQTTKEDSETKVMGKLGREGYWPVTISYFDDDKNQNGLPVYRTSFLLYENGITRDLIMDYGNFSIKGKLKSLRLLGADNKKTDCKK